MGGFDSEVTNETTTVMFEAAVFNPAYFVPARVMVGLGGVCFTLFSIVSILESGTANVN